MLTFHSQAATSAIFYNTIDRKQVETSLDIRAQQQAAVAELGQQALSGTDLAVLVSEAIALTVQTLNVDCCGIFEWIGEALLLKAGLGWQKGAVESARIEFWENSPLSYTLLTQQPTISENFQAETLFGKPSLLHDHHIVSGMSVVIPGQKQPFGVLGGYTTQPRSFSQDDVYFLQAIANVLATAMQRQRAEAQLNLMERAIASSSNGVVLTDVSLPDNPIIYVNPAFEVMTGYSAAEVIGRNCRFLQGNDSQQPELEELRTAIRERRECHVTLRNYRKDHSLFWNDLRIAPVFDGVGNLTHFVGIQTDITDRILAETALHEQKEQYRRIVETATEGIWLLDRENRTSFVNQQMATMLGYSISDMLGKPLFAFMDEEGIALANSYLSRRHQGIHEAHDFKFCRKDGSDLWAIVSTAPLSDAEGNYAGALGMLTDITDRKQAEAALQDSEQRLEGILRSIEDMVWSVSATTFDLLFFNSAAEKIYGRSRTDFYKNSDLWLTVVHPDDRERVRHNAKSLLTTGSKAIEYRIVRPDGEVRWLYDRGWVTYDAQGKAQRLDGIASDITDRKQSEEALRKSEEQFRLVFELAPIGMALTTPDGKYLTVNRALCHMFDYTTDELFNLTFADITHADDIAASMAFNQKLRSGELSNFQMEKRYLAKGGRIVYCLLQATLVRDHDGNPLHIIAQMVDITDRKRMEDQLAHNAFHDELTGLPNRALFMDRLQQAITRSKRHLNERFAVLFLDLDRFKVVNDSLGHLIGDQLLIAIAQRLQTCLRPGDTVARLGGDEFTILLHPIKTINDVTVVAERIHQVLRSPLNLDGHEVFTSVSIGIALHTSEDDQPNDLLRNADTAMYRAKEQGRDCYAIFDTVMYDRAVAALQIETDLRWAIERQEFRVCYQPIFGLKTKQISGFEALLRWQHPERGLISPAEFIPIAEETGLIVPIGWWILKEACQQLCEWQRQFPSQSSLAINVNLSVKQFSQPDLAEQIDRVLSETGLNPRCLKLEITESGIMQNAQSAAALLAHLKALNVEVCIDDFGTGYSSLSRLYQFPIDTLKIDRSFIHTMSEQNENAKIVQAIITLAHNLGMSVVAEGVETADQLTQLRDFQCEYGQGYFFSKPLPRELAAQLIQETLF